MSAIAALMDDGKVTIATLLNAIIISVFQGALCIKVIIIATTINEKT